MITHEARDGTTGELLERRVVQEIPRNFRVAGAELREILARSDERVRAENLEKTDPEIVALQLETQKKLAIAFMKEREMGALARGLSAEDAKAEGMRAAVGDATIEGEIKQKPRNHPQEVPTPAPIPQNPENNQDDNDQMWRRYLIAMCYLAHGKGFESLNEDTLIDIAGLSPQPRFTFERWKKSVT